ncbi:MAG: ABC transporter permease [Ruminococcaceae bacterium]|nr:ABC transporter permease [Oscillospiraceae bacterium]
MFKKYLVYPHLFWMLVFVLVPILLVLVYSFETTGLNGEAIFTLENYQKLVDANYLNIFIRSVYLAVISSIICLALGYPISVILANREKRTGKSGLVWIFILPMWMNMLLRTYSWLTILEKNGILNNLLELLNLPQVNILYTSGAVVLGMVYNFLPFMILPIYSVLIKIDNSIIEAAEDLGANSFTVFSKVTLPLSIPGVVSGVTMVFLPAVTTFIISKLLGGGHYMLIGNLIENQFLVADNWNFGSAISILMMVLILLSMAITNVFEKDTSTEKKGGKK